METHLALRRAKAMALRRLGAVHEGRSRLLLTAETELLSCRRVSDVALIEAGKKKSCCHVTAAVCRFGRKDPCYCAALAYCCSQCCLVHRWRKVFCWHGKRSAPFTTKNRGYQHLNLATDNSVAKFSNRLATDYTYIIFLILATGFSNGKSVANFTLNLATDFPLQIEKINI